MQQASNVDAQELAKFSDLAHKWWDADSEFRPLHLINPLRRDWISRCSGPLHQRKVLDVGCGGGILAESMAREGAEVLGIDLAEKSLKVAQLHALEQQVAGLTYRCVSAEALADQSPNQFDIVTCMEMLEHVPDPTAVVRACARLARPGGWVFFSTLNRNVRSFLAGIVAAEYILGLLPRGTHDYSRFLRPSELGRAARESGLSLHEGKGLSYNPITKRYRLSDDLSVNYLLAFRKEGIEG